MGGCCCCASRGVEINNTPSFYHYQLSSEEHEPLSANLGPASSFSTGVLVDTNLDMSSPDTYRPPPAPLPYDANIMHARSPPINQDVGGNKEDAATGTTDGGNSIEAFEKDLKNTELQEKSESVLISEEKEIQLEKSGDLKKSVDPLFEKLEEEDCCPTCLEEYDTENPKIITKCEHHFHLACILEWMERSDTCPVCDQEMVFSPNING